MKFQAQFEQWVPMPLEKVFLFFANPDNLPRLMPPGTTAIRELKLVAPPAIEHIDSRGLAGVGSEIITEVRPVPWLPFRTKWVALITEFEWNHHFADAQKRGPFRSFHHRHEFAAETRKATAGTRIFDRIEYELGFGLLGDLAQKLFVTNLLRRTFEYRQAALERLLTCQMR